MSAIRLNHFDRGKPFYPLVINYLVLLHGFKELAVRGIAGSRDVEDLAARIPAIAESREAAKVIEIKVGLRKLAGPLELRSEYGNNSITVSADEIGHEVVANSQYLSSFLMRSAGSLLILAHELSIDAPWHDQNPLLEFLRHCRNAAAHGGKFHFKHGKPSKLAQWGTFQITFGLEGTPLFKGADGTGLLSPGDPIRLLWDIEQAFPQMTA